MPEGEGSGDMVGEFGEDSELRLFDRKEGDQKATVVLNKREPKGHPKGAPGEIRLGFSFYQVRKKDKSSETPKLSYITSRMSDEPVLEAIGDKQYKNWQGLDIIARPVQYRWSEEKGIWVIVEENVP